MKSSSITLLFLYAAAFVLVGCVPKPTSPKPPPTPGKVASRNPTHPSKVIHSVSRSFDAEPKTAEQIKAFYLDLIESNASIRSQFDSLTEETSNECGGIFHISDPNVIEWFPTEDGWNYGEKFENDDHYLVIQPIGFGRGRRAGNAAAVVSEFHVTVNGKKMSDKSNDERMAVTTTITFLGFRNLQLKTIK